MKKALAPFLLLAAAACGASVAHESPAPAPVAEAAPRAPARGREERVNGVRVVHLAGTPEEMGRQMGEICGPSLRHLVDANLMRIPPVARDPKKALEAARAFAAAIPDDQMRELRATARAAGVSEDALVLAAAVVEVVEASKACAAVAAWGGATASRETIVGRNLDWFDIGGLHEHGLVVVRRPPAGRAHASFGFPGIPGVLTGMNDDGVFVSNLVQYARNAPPPAAGGVPVMSLQRLALERCASAEAAVALIEGAPRTVPQNYLVADAAGAFFLETDAARARRRNPLDETLAGTNWAGEERGRLVGDVRFGMMCASFDPERGRIDTAVMEKALGAANAGPLSVLSIVAVPARRFARVSIGNSPACKGPFVDLDVGALLGSEPR